LLEACRRSPTVQQVVVASSNKAYGEHERLPYDEAAPLQGRHPYDVSKACTDLTAQSYAATYQLPVAITRSGNFYRGGELNWNRIVPGMIRSVLIDSPEGFEAISWAWLQSGWDVKYVYSFSWMGRPIIQLLDDMFRIQEVLYRVKPDVILETGVAHGGSLMFYATLLKAMGRGRVIGVDVEIRPHNRAAVEAHELFPYIALIN
jgi:hypothetical protein